MNKSRKSSIALGGLLAYMVLLVPEAATAQRAGFKVPTALKPPKSAALGLNKPGNSPGDAIDHPLQPLAAPEIRETVRIVNEYLSWAC